MFVGPVIMSSESRNVNQPIIRIVESFERPDKLRIDVELVVGLVDDYPHGLDSNSG
jgi:hypothetical protein